MRPLLAFWTVVLLSTALLAAPAAGAETYAVVDRIGDDYAVLLLEEGDETIEQRVVDPAVLDEPGRYEGAVHHVVDGEYVYEASESERRERSASARFDGRAAGC